MTYGEQVLNTREKLINVSSNIVETEKVVKQGEQAKKTLDGLYEEEKALIAKLLCEKQEA